jgi:hypothetical protein
MVTLFLVTDWVDRAFNGLLLPILGVVFLPWTTVLWTIGYVASGDAAAPWGIVAIFIGLFLDVALHARSVTMGKKSYQGR